MRVWPFTDSGPVTFWNITEDPVGTVNKDGFGDDCVVVEIPDVLWDEYQACKKTIEDLINQGQEVPYGNRQ